MRNKAFDMSDEFLLQPHGDGFKLVRPNTQLIEPCQNTSVLHNIAEVFKSSLNLYFLDDQSVIRNMNETCVITCNYPSIKSSIGKTRNLVAKRDVVEKITDEDRQTMQNKRLMVFEEHFERIDDISFPAIAFKYPWYDADDEVIGLLGCSIVLEQNSLVSMASSINSMLNLGLLKSNSNINAPAFALPGRHIDGVYLSQRETQCLQGIIQGKTAKMIAKILSLSSRTVEHYIENIRIKLNVKSKQELIDKVLGGLIL